MSGRLRTAAEVLFVATEAIAWYVVLRVFASVLERGALVDLAAAIELGRGGAQFASETAATRALEVARQAANEIAAGPPLWSVLLAAGGAFALSRAITRARIGSMGTILGLLVSLLSLNLLLHVILAGDLRLWDSSGVAGFLGEPQESRLEPAAFVARPDPGAVMGRSYSLVAAGLAAVWLRFLVAGRGRLTFDRVLRSFSAGFPFVLLSAFVASAAGVPTGGMAVAYFVAGVLTLAVANAARASDQGEEFAHRAPWAISVLGTVALLAGLALLLGALAALNAGAVFALVGNAVVRAVSFVLVLILTPIFWVLEGVLGAVFGNADLSFLSRALDNARVIDPNAPREPGKVQPPGWLFDVLRLLGLALLAGIAYFVGRFIFRRVTASEAGDYVEEREGMRESSGLGGLLRNLVPGLAPRGADDNRWLDRHAAYRLFARVVNGSAERGFAKRPGETPLEFAGASSRALDAPSFPPIAEHFDRARYGSHFPSEGELRPLAESLARWEAANPVTDEARQRRRGEAGPDLDLGPEPEQETPAGPFDAPSI